MRRAAVALVAGLALAAAASAHGPAAPPAPRPASAPVSLPEPGSYELPPIGTVTEHRLLDPDGHPAALLARDPGALALVSFVYTHCPDVCPSALAVLQAVDRRLAADPQLAPHVRLVTVSFDPAHDTPERMGVLRRALAPQADWRFLTARSGAELEPVLEDYGQDVLALVDARGHATGLLRHVLKVFLVDARGQVRNIYSAGFLSEDLLLRDLRTLRLEQAPQTGAP